MCQRRNRVWKECGQLQRECLTLRVLSDLQGVTAKDVLLSYYQSPLCLHCYIQCWERTGERWATMELSLRWLFPVFWVCNAWLRSGKTVENWHLWEHGFMFESGSQQKMAQRSCLTVEDYLINYELVTSKTQSRIVHHFLHKQSVIEVG